MARSFGESFQQPLDVFTNKPIPGTPKIAVSRNGSHGTSGVVVLNDTFENTRPDGSPIVKPITDQPYVTGSCDNCSY